MCSYTALGVNSFDMVCYMHFWRAVLGLGARWFLAGRAVPSEVELAMGRAPMVFRLGEGLEPTFQATMNQRFLGRLDDSHVILSTSVAKRRGRPVWSALLACCSSCAAAVFSGDCRHVWLCSVLCSNVSCSMAQAYIVMSQDASFRTHVVQCCYVRKLLESDMPHSTLERSVFCMLGCHCSLCIA